MPSTNKTPNLGLSQFVNNSAVDSDQLTAADYNADMLAIDGAVIVESDSNANGSYVKWADGTMICEMEYSGSVASTRTLTSGGYRTSGLTFTYPAVFHSAPKLYPSLEDSTFMSVGAVPQSGNETTIGLLVFRSITSYTGDATVVILAVGRWK